jgi:hypothetical protein
MIASLLFVSCKKEAVTPETPFTTSQPTSQQLNQLRTDFAKILARAIANPQVKSLIKEESLKQFNNDYDVLFQMIKDKEVQPGITFTDQLSSLGLTEQMRTAIDNSLPLLTIFVPDLPHFSADKWNIESDIPIVAVVNDDFSEKEQTPIPAFDHNGNQLQLKSNKAPAVPVIVVKDNERVIASTKNEVNARISRENFIFSSSSNDFYFTDERFNHSKTGTEKFIVSVLQGILSSKAAAAFSNGIASQRDYTYYNISSPGGQGKLDLGQGEYLSGIAFDPNSGWFMYDDNISDWSDGSFEFQLDVLLFNGSSTLNKISKVFSVPVNERYFTTSETIWFSFPSPILIATWDMKQYGDTWKYVLNELDPGSTTTISYSATTKIGSNFSYNSSTGEEYKIGTGFGSSFEQSFTNSIQIQIPQASDFCGEAIVNYMSPVITGLQFGGGIGGMARYHVAEVNTGIARMLIYPRTIQ